MSAILTAVTVSDLLHHLGDLPAARVRVHPEPGTATEADVVQVYAQEKRLCELVDGVLVEKTVGYYEAYIAATLIRLLGNFVAEHDLGFIAGADGMIRLAPGLVRIPDVSFVAWTQLPSRQVPRQAIPDLRPALVVEVVSDSNTPREMARKLDEYFTWGVQMVWLVDPQHATVDVYTSRQQWHTYDTTATLDGGRVLPGLALPVRALFAAPGA